MSYTPTEWKAGDTVTSAKLNKIEQGIANNIMILHETEVNGEGVLDKTVEEIVEAIQNKIVFINYVGPYGIMQLIVNCVEAYDDNYYLCTTPSVPISWKANTINDYLSRSITDISNDDDELILK